MICFYQVLCDNKYVYMLLSVGKKKMSLSSLNVDELDLGLAGRKGCNSF